MSDSEDDIDTTALPESDLACSDPRVLDLLVRLEYLEELDGKYYVTEEGQEEGLGPDEEE